MIGATQFSRQRLQGLGPLVTLFVVLLLAPPFAPTPYVLSIWTFIALNLIVVISLDLVVGYAGQLSLGQGVFVSVGAYTSALLTTAVSWSGWAAIPAGMTAAALLALIVGVPTLRLRGYYLAMVTLGFPVVFDAVIRQFSDFTGGSSGVVSIPRLHFGDEPLRGGLPFYYLALASCALVAAVAWVTAQSRWGIVLRTIHADEALAKAKGVSIAKVKVAVFVVSAASAALSGGLYAHYVQFVAPDTFGILYSIMVLVMLLVGGMGRIWGAVLGTIVMMWLPELLRATSHWETVIFGCALVAIMLFAPSGLAGLVQRRPIARLEKSVAAAKSITPIASELLVVSGISKRFGGIQAVSNVNVSVRSGEIKAIIGPNGAGKSTLLALISGAIPIDEGTVVFCGKRVERWSANRRACAGISRTFQHARLVHDLTVFENIRLGTYAGDDRDGTAAAGLAMADLELAVFADRYPGEVDQFTARLTEIAAAIASNPRLLLLDEPAAGLSEQEVERLLTLLHRLRSRGMAIVVVDHVMQLILGSADNVIVLDHGVMVAEAPADQILSNDHVRKSYLGQALELADA